MLNCFCLRLSLHLSSYRPPRNVWEEETDCYLYGVFYSLDFVDCGVL